MEQPITVSPEWEQIDRTLLHGPVMIVGASNVGKTTFARWLFQVLLHEHTGPVAFLDGDPGQSELGPPTTLTLAEAGASRVFPPTGRILRWFVGSTSPRGHMLVQLAGVGRLVEAAHSDGIGTIIHDTTGLVSPAFGGVALKLAEMDLLRPRVVIAIQDSGELEPLLACLRRSRRMQLIELHTSPFLRGRNVTVRAHHRAEAFVRYFTGAGLVELDTSRLAVVSLRALQPNQVVSLEDAGGFSVALGVITRPGRIVQILTPLRDVAAVDTLRYGNVFVDPATGTHWLPQISHLPPRPPQRGPSHPRAG